MVVTGFFAQWSQLSLKMSYKQMLDSKHVFWVFLTKQELVINSKTEIQHRSVISAKLKYSTAITFPGIIIYA